MNLNDGDSEQGLPGKETSGSWFGALIILGAVQMMQDEGREGRFPPAWAAPLLALGAQGGTQGPCDCSSRALDGADCH